MPNFLTTFDLLHILMLLPAVIIGLSVHEASHAFMAHALGDSTARDQGRSTFNPLVHIDLLGLVFIMIVGFGWAKPVSFNDANLKKPDRDVRLIAAAGPLSNALLAIIGSAAYVLFVNTYGLNLTGFMASLETMLWDFVLINWGLFVFNLLPFPPLDGSHLAFYGLRHYPQVYHALYFYGNFALFGLLMIQAWVGQSILPINEIIYFLANAGTKLFGLG